MNFSTRALSTVAAGATLLVGLAGGAIAQNATGYYTTEQADRGHATFDAQCSMCHGKNLEGVEAPALSGVDVMGNWITAEGMYDYFSVAMPATAPGKLQPQEYLDIMAYILQFNGAPAGDKELTKDDMPNINLVAATTQGGAAAPAAPAATAPAPDAPKVPQAFTAGKQLPTVAPTDQPAAAPAAPAEPAQPKVPQAFTYGKQLPTVGQ